MQTLIFSNDIKIGVLLLESLVSELKLKEVDSVLIRDIQQPLYLLKMETLIRLLR